MRVKGQSNKSSHISVKSDSSRHSSQVTNQSRVNNTATENSYIIRILEYFWQRIFEFSNDPSPTSSNQLTHLSQVDSDIRRWIPADGDARQVARYAGNECQLSHRPIVLSFVTWLDDVMRWRHRAGRSCVRSGREEDWLNWSWNRFTPSPLIVLNTETPNCELRNVKDLC